MGPAAVFTSMIALFAALGCGGRESGDGRGGSSGATAAGSGTTAGRSGASASPPAGGPGGLGDAGSGVRSEDAGSDANGLCEATGGMEILFQNAAQAQAYLVGRWVLCGGPGLVFATEQRDQAGLELTSSFGWYSLHPSGPNLTRAAGFQAYGTYRFNAPQDLDSQPSMTAVLFFGADYSFANVTMLDSPRKMRIQFLSPLNQQASIYVRESP